MFFGVPGKNDYFIKRAGRHACYDTHPKPYFITGWEFPEIIFSSDSPLKIYHFFTLFGVCLLRHLTLDRHYQFATDVLKKVDTKVFFDLLKSA